MNTITITVIISEYLYIENTISYYMDEPRTETRISHIGDGSLFLIVYYDVSMREEGSMTWTDNNPSGFRIANLDEDENVIDGQSIDFSVSAAVHLSSGLRKVQNLPLSMMGLPGVKLYPLENGDLIIERDGISITIHQSDIRDLAGAISSINSIRDSNFTSR